MEYLRENHTNIILLHPYIPKLYQIEEAFSMIKAQFHKIRILKILIKMWFTIFLPILPAFLPIWDRLSKMVCIENLLIEFHIFDSLYVHNVILKILFWMYSISVLSICKFVFIYINLSFIYIDLHFIYINLYFIYINL